MKTMAIPALLLASIITIVGVLPLGTTTAQQPPIDLPSQFQCAFGEATSLSAVTFLCVEGYAPWAALIVEAGDPFGIDQATATFDGTTLRIEVTDSDEGVDPNVIILINKAFADDHLVEFGSDPAIQTSDAVNYEGLESSHTQAPGGIGGPFYVFIISSFSTQFIEMSKGFPVLLVAGGAVAALVVLAAVVVLLRRRR